MTSRSSIPTPTASRAGGFVLIEALIAILIFSIGVLGIVGLQATAVQQSSDARYRAQAAELAQQLLGQMWTGDRTAATLQTQYNCTPPATPPGRIRSRPPCPACRPTPR